MINEVPDACMSNHFPQFLKVAFGGDLDRVREIMKRLDAHIRDRYDARHDFREFLEKRYALYPEPDKDFAELTAISLLPPERQYESKQGGTA
jgi:hypothetical protein